MKDKITPILFILMILTIIVIAAYIVPLGVVWSLNTLFDTGITLTWSTWFAIMFLIVVFGPKTVNINKRG